MEKTRTKRLDRLKLRIVDASCASCFLQVRRELEQSNGVEWVGANVILDLIFVDYDPDLTDTNQILATVKRSGFTAVRAAQ